MLSLTLLSLTANTAIETQKQLKEIFGDIVEIKSTYIEELSPHTKLKDNLVVFTTQTEKENILKYINPDTKLIMANRIVNIENLCKLYEIPIGSSVIVVNKLRKTTLEAIDQLIEAGITHLKFFPYYPDIDAWNKDCKYAITFGEEQLVPNKENNIINLGIRPIDINTCIEIAMELKIYENVKHTLTSAFFRSSLQLLYHFSQECRKNLFLTQKLQHLLNIFKSGIVLLDQNREVSFYNLKAEQLLGIKKNSSNHISSIIKKSKISGEDFFYTINEKKYHIEIKNNSLGTIITIEDIKNIEKIEKNYRLSLHERGLVAEYTFKDIMHKSEVMQQLVLKAKHFAKSKSTILIEGESGTGKELFAQAIHNASERASEAFVAVNFAALSESLCESELFGYDEGAFTGARRGGKKGLFEMAHKGTIFLDEIGDASISIQKKILRVIQERQVFPVGGSQIIPIDIRIIAATNRDLHIMVNERSFRQDLFYRLNVLPIRIPPLKERTEDIFPIFINMLQNKFNVNINIEDFPDAIQRELVLYDWAGNLRELRNMAEYISNYIQINLDWKRELLYILRYKTNKLFREEKAENHHNSQNLINKLEEHGQLSDFMNILKILNTHPFKWTRKEVSNELEKCGIIMSESQIKRRLLVMKELNLAHSKTGDGTYIKDLGRILLNKYT